MKAHEAISILEGVDPQSEVTLTIGRTRQTSKEPWPYREHVGTPMYRTYPAYVPDVTFAPNTVVCH